MCTNDDDVRLEVKKKETTMEMEEKNKPHKTLLYAIEVKWK